MTMIMKVYTSQIEKIQRDIYQLYRRAQADEHLALVDKLEVLAMIRNIGQIAKV